MADETLLEQASHLECLLPRLMRRLFTLDPDHPAAELPLAQLRLCAILSSGPRTISAIGEELGISASAVTQIADRLERAGLVERVSESDDRRVRYLQLTPQGVEIMRSRRELRICRAAQALEQLAPETREAVLQALQALLKASIATAPDPPAQDLMGLRIEQ